MHHTTVSRKTGGSLARRLRSVARALLVAAVGLLVFGVPSAVASLADSLDGEPLFFSYGEPERPARTAELEAPFPNDLSEAYQLAQPPCPYDGEDGWCVASIDGLSPSGEYVVYNYGEVQWEPTWLATKSELVIQRTDGFGRSVIRDNLVSGYTGKPRFTADGGSLVFLRYEDGDVQIVRRSLASGQETLLVSQDDMPLHDVIGQPSLSADGELMAYPQTIIANGDYAGTNIVIARASDGDPVKTIETDLQATDTFEGVQLSPDGETVLALGWETLESDMYLYTIDVGSEDMEAITAANKGVYPRWTPDGERVTYCKGPPEPEPPSEEWDPYSIVSILPDGTDEQTVFHSWWCEYTFRQPSTLLDALVDHRPEYAFDSLEDFYPQKIEAFTNNYEIEEGQGYQVSDELVNRLLDDEDNVLAAAGSLESPPALDPATLGEHYGFGERDESETGDYIDARGNTFYEYFTDSATQSLAGNGPVVYGRPIRRS